MRKSLLILIAIVSLISCSTKIVTVPVDLGPCPLSPELVTMTEAQYLQFSQLDPEIVKVLNKREDQLQAHIRTLCDIIEASHGTR